jgi:SAM-dependent methyltransferase
MLYKDNVIDYLVYTESMTEKGLIDNNVDQKSEFFNNIIIDVRFLKDLYKIYQPNLTFLELGCGVGNVLRFAKNIGFKVTGIEINQNLIQDNTEVINMDIQKYPVENYKNYDVIYIYRPLKNGYDDYINLIIDNMKSGSILMTPMTIQNNPILKTVGLFMYQKLSSV